MTSIIIKDLLVCPTCKNKLSISENNASCTHCEQVYDFHDGIPCLIPPQSVFWKKADPGDITDIKDSNNRITLKSIAKKLIPNPTIWINTNLFKHLNNCSEDDIILNLGSGIGLFDKYITSKLKIINLDIHVNTEVHLLADAHFLPFNDNSLDAVYSNAVLEHVQRPWIVADEIYRVLKPGGRIFISAPFLNVIHDKHDYFRFTDKGLGILFEGFVEIESGISAGPSSFLTPFYMEYIANFLPGAFLKDIGRFFISVLLWPIKYIDIPVRNAKTMRLTADAFYFIGKKPNI